MASNPKNTELLERLSPSKLVTLDYAPVTSNPTYAAMQEEAHNGSELAARILELVHYCNGTETECLRAGRQAYTDASSVSSQFIALLESSDRGDEYLKALKKSISAFHFSVLGETAMYDNFYSKLRTAVEMLEEANSGLSVNFNGKAMKTEQEPEKKRTIVSVLEKHIGEMTKLLEEYGGIIDRMTHQHNGALDILDSYAAARQVPSAGAPKAKM